MSPQKFCVLLSVLSTPCFSLHVHVCAHVSVSVCIYGCVCGCVAVFCQRSTFALTMELSPDIKSQFLYLENVQNVFRSGSTKNCTTLESQALSSACTIVRNVLILFL